MDQLLRQLRDRLQCDGSMLNEKQKNLTKRQQKSENTPCLRIFSHVTGYGHEEDNTKHVREETHT